MDEQETMKFCRAKSSSGHWMKYMGYFKPVGRNAAYYTFHACQSKDTFYRKRNAIFIVEAPASLWEMLCSENKGDVGIAESVLNAEVRKQKLQLNDPKKI